MRSHRVAVRSAKDEELPAVMAVLDAAMLEVDADSVRNRLHGGERVPDRTPGDVLVATEGNRILGICVLESRASGAHIEAIAVRPGRRDQGIGTMLVEAAANRRGELTAEFGERVRPFYVALGFEVERAGDGRYRGSLGEARRS